jgi:hypothetical protein
MAIIPAFPTASPELSDLLLGTKIKVGGNTTNNFTIEEVLALIGDPYPIPASVNYGLFSQTDSSPLIGNTTIVGNLYGTGVGSRTIAANTLLTGSSLNIRMTGALSSLAAATLEITVATSDGVILAGTGAMTMSAATSKQWSLDMDLTVRQAGAAGTAIATTATRFSYNKNGSNTPELLSFEKQNEEDFDTTVSNTIVVTVQWGTASASNLIYCGLFNLTKTY